MVSDFAVVRSGRSVAIVRNDFRSEFTQHRLLDCPEPRLRAVSATSSISRGGQAVPGGRGEVRIVEAGHLGEAVVRPYLRGGFVERFNRRLYFLGNRAFSELIATHRLRLRGAPVPEVLAAVQRRRGIAYTACLVTRRVPRSAPASVVLAGTDPGQTEIVLEAIGRAVRRFHEAGGQHADLNAHNVLVSADREPTVTLIDLDRARVAPGPIAGPAAAANLGRLRRSLAKLELDLALSEWGLLQRAYAEPPEPPPAA